MAFLLNHSFSMEQWSNGLGAGFSIQGSLIQNYWVAPSSSQRFILLRSIKGVPGTPADLVIKSKLSRRSGFVALRQLNKSKSKGDTRYEAFMSLKRTVYREIY